MGDNQVLTFAVGIFVGMTLVNFFEAVMRDLVLPVLSPLASAEAGVSKLVVQLGSIKLNVGDVIVQFLNVIIAFTVISFLLPYLKDYVPVAGRR